VGVADVRKRVDEKKRGPVVAIDGPSGVGKSTLARSVAERVGCRYVDTGAMYRAVALLARQRGVSQDDEQALARISGEMDIEFVETKEGQGVRLEGEDVTLALRLPGVSEEASRLSRFPQVRKVLVERQRALGRHGPVVMEGRDIGTVVLPEADLKIFLEADVEERARRRYGQWKGKGIEVAREQLKQEILSRDHRDQTREVAPLAPARDAVRIDTTQLNPEQALDRVLTLLAEKGFLEEEGER
jgi:CMP/dCMP kinase